jgi:protein subunit release factor A
MARSMGDKKENQIKVKDEIGQQIFDEQVKSLKREIVDFNKTIADKIKDKANYMEQVEVADEMNDIITKNFKKLTPMYAFETVPRYWELQLKQHEFKVRQQKATDEGMAKRFDYEIEHAKKSVAETEQRLAKLLSGE